MNERDSEAAAGMLTSHGYEITKSEEDADILIFNTCSVRDQAERKAIGKIGILRRLKRRKPDIFIGIMGCMAQRKGEELLEELTHVDFVIGTKQLHKLPEIVNKEIKERYKEVCIGTDGEVLTNMDAHFSNSEDGSDVTAFIAIMRGCNRFCSYCIVPYVRGREQSRDVADIVKEAKELVSKGVKDIMLLGQNVAAFGLDGTPPPPADDYSPFADLLEEVSKIEGLHRVRFASPHPAYFNNKLIDTIATLPKVCKSIHLPMQSGSDRVLKLMNRPYTAKRFLEIANSLKSKSPGIVFSTDIIVGFPGETDEDFNATREMMNEIGFDNAYIFKYSPRKDTPAATMEDQVEQKVKEERNQFLLADLSGRTSKRNLEYIGQSVEVLVEGPSKRNIERWAGRTESNKISIFTPTSDLKIGDLVRVKIDRTTSMSLFGTIEE